MANNKRTLIGLIIATFIILALGVFVFFNARLFVKGPQIQILGPKNGSSFSDPFIELKGKAINVSFISINDNPIFIDESGNFNEKLLLPPGLSIIKVYAHDRFKRNETVSLQYLYTGEALTVKDTDIEEEQTETSTTTLEEI